MTVGRYAALLKSETFDGCVNIGADCDGRAN